MIPRRIQGANFTYTAPRNWDAAKNGECHPLSVRATQHGDTVMIQSAWEPTPEELKLLCAGGSIVLTVVGGQPPVALHVEPPVKGGE